jgi:hypothetical protein
VLRTRAQNFDTVAAYINGVVEPCFKRKIFEIISAGRIFCKVVNISLQWYLHIAVVEGLVSSSDPES